MRQEDVANEAEVSQKLVSEIERGEQDLLMVSVSRLARLAAALDWSLNELQSSTGLNLGIRDVASHDEVKPVANVHIVPVRTLAAAGPAFYTEAAVIDSEVVENHLFRDAMLVVQVTGDSMTPQLHEEDRVYIDTRDLDKQDGKIYLLHLHGNGFVLKRMRKMGSSWLLTSDNPAYPPLPTHDATIVGRAYHRTRGEKL